MMSRAPERRTVRLADYAPPAFSTVRVELDFDLEPDRTTVTARQSFARRAGASAPLVLDGEGLELVRIAMDGAALAPEAYRLDATCLTLPDPPERFTLEITNRIAPAANTALEGLYISSGIFCTQCEAEGFRRITWFQDRPDVMTRFRVRIEAEKARYPHLLSNGNPIGQGDLPKGRHWALWDDPFPKPAYLFALVAGDLALLRDHFTTRSGRTVELRIYSEHELIDQCHHAMASLKKSMAWDEERYGLEYDLDLFMIVAVSDFNMGAMENKGLNIFNTSATLAHPTTATDADFVQVERIIAHEYFHNWTGNRVTCRDWFQLTLKEGLTVFRDQQFTSDMHSAAVKRIGDVTMLREGQFPEDAGPLAHPIRPAEYMEINNFYTRTVYEKGAEVIRMIHTLIGEEAFRRGMDLYFARHDGEAVTCEDFVACMAEASGRDFGRFMRWYDQAGTPRVVATDAWDAASGRYSLTLEQSTPPTPGQARKLPLEIPIRMGLIDRRTGDPMPLQLSGENRPEGDERVLELRQAKETFTFENVTSRPLPSLLRGFSAPVELTLDLGRAELATLLARDTDTFNRWEAGQRLLLDQMQGLLGDFRAGKELALDPVILPALQAVLDDAAGDPAFAARALALPSRNVLAQSLPVIDVEGVDAVATYLRRAIGQGLAAAWVRVLEAAGESHREAPAEVAPTTEAMGRRALKNTALAYLVWSGLDSAPPLAAAQYHEARNMTDRLAALKALCDVQAEPYEALLTDFHARFERSPLVINKWFALQATIEDARSVERVRRLLHHPAFTLANPNRVRSLVGMFATGNLTGFHRPDGAGYRLLTETALELDRKNPQTAARLLLTLGRWRRFDPARQTLMRAELERIAATPGLSKDAYEVVTKSLG
ncbi:MAG TPA: aminopeptidase N [Geminicoccaceae bacterium]|jgi:aminopeptidase N|nr:aminopeptidase N [Geminicoccaceae bacterium]